MKSIFDYFIIEKHSLILEEKDLVRVLKTLNSHCRIAPRIVVGTCGWSKGNRWFIHFNISRSKWELMRKELNVIRVFDYSGIPEGDGGVYTKD